MNIYLEQPGWVYVKCGGTFYSVTTEVNNRLMELERLRGKYANVSEDETFDAFELSKNQDGDYFNNGKYPKTLKVNKIETFIGILNR